MASLKEAELLARGDTALGKMSKAVEAWGLDSLSARKDSVQNAAQNFDIFLSHSSNEPKKLLAGIKETLEGLGFSIYIDVFNDPHLSAAQVTAETANVIRNRLRQSRSLLYVYSSYSTQSRWMPWELGFFDGKNGKVGICSTEERISLYKREEYLNLYPYVDIQRLKGSSVEKLWINKDSNTYAQFREWIDGKEEIRKRTA